MHKVLRLFFVLSLSLCPLTFAIADDAAQSLSLTSPDGRLEMTFRLAEQGRPVFEVMHREVPIVIGSLGLEFAESGMLGDSLEVVGVRRASHDEVYKIPIGKASEARDHHNELIVSLEETLPPHRKIDIVLRAFNEGVAFRYFLPEQETLRDFVLTDEHTQFLFPGNGNALLCPLARLSVVPKHGVDGSLLAIGSQVPIPLLHLLCLMSHPAVDHSLVYPFSRGIGCEGVPEDVKPSYLLPWRILEGGLEVIVRGIHGEVLFPRLMESKLTSERGGKVFLVDLAHETSHWNPTIAESVLARTLLFSYSNRATLKVEVVALSPQQFATSHAGVGHQHEHRIHKSW